MSSLSRTLACCLLVAACFGAADDDQSLEPTVTVEAKLLEKSEPPNMADANVLQYGEGLVLFRWQVTKVVKGDLKDQEVLVTHWGLKRRMLQPIINTEIGAAATLNLRPFAECASATKLDEVFLSQTLKDEQAVVKLTKLHDVRQQLLLPQWKYNIDLNRNMPAFHLLKNQLKLVVLGDCQGWFSNRTELHYGEENKKTPVALNLCQERSYLGMYECLVDDYIVKLPKIEWVVIAYHTRWINGRAGWREKGAKVRKFKSSPGYKYDMANAELVFKPVDHPPITLEQVLAAPGIGDTWKKHPWGQLAHVGGKKTGIRGGPKSSFGQDRWDHYVRIVDKLAAKKIKVLAYTLPVHPQSAKLDKKDKAGTSTKDYDTQVAKNKELMEKHKGYYFFLDYNDKGNHGLDPNKDFANCDHIATSGAIKCTTAVEKYRLECEAKSK